MSYTIHTDYLGRKILNIQDGNFNEKLISADLDSVAGEKLHLVFSGVYTAKRANTVFEQIQKLCSDKGITLVEGR